MTAGDTDARSGTDRPPSPRPDQTMDDASSISTARRVRVRGLAIPGGLVHPHVHLDKCYLLDRTPIDDGSFGEAMQRTADAKARFIEQDIYDRGRRLVQASLQHGVLAMRAHVEVDPTVGHKCLEAGRRLRHDFASHCDIQLVAFAQDPIHYPDDERKQEKMLQLLIEACQAPDVEVVGSAPYVETSTARETASASKNTMAQRENIRIIFDLADRFDKDVDFHLDYNLDPATEPLLWYVLEEAHRRTWSRHICIGHATRMSLFGRTEWDRVETLCRGLQVAFVGLPPSDLYMQGRGTPYVCRSRATLPMLECVSRFLSTALGVNNVANLFTPQGDGDPLALMPLVVGLWQSATPDHLAAMLSMVSSSAHGIVRKCDVVMPPSEIDVEFDDAGNVVTAVFASTMDTEGGEQEQTPFEADTFTLLPNCKSVQDAVLSPPSARYAVRRRRLVAWRRVNEGVAGLSPLY